MPRLRLHLARTAGLGLSSVGYTHQASIELELNEEDCKRLGASLSKCLEEIVSQPSIVSVLYYGFVEAQVSRVARDLKQLVMKRIATLLGKLWVYK